MRMLGTVLGGAALVAIVGAVVIVGRSPTPFERSGEAAVGQVHSNLGSTYTVEAASLTSTWTFTRDADVVLRFEAGTLTLDGQSLQVGCYSGTIAKGSVLAIADARDLRFASPSSDATCRSLP